MILIAVPFTAISVTPHISDTFHYRPCNKYKIEIRTYRNFKQEMEIFLTRIRQKIKLRFYSTMMRTICHANKFAKEASATSLMPSHEI